MLEDAPALDKSEKADVVVVRSGIAGISTAWELIEVGKTVGVLDRGPIGKRMTPRTAAILRPSAIGSVKAGGRPIGIGKTARGDRKRRTLQHARRS